MKLLITLLTISTLFVLPADEKTDKPKEVQPPVISTKDAASFWKATTKVLEIAPEWKKRNQDVDEARAKLDKICGSAYQLIDDGDLKCVLKKETKQ